MNCDCPECIIIYGATRNVPPVLFNIHDSCFVGLFPFTRQETYLLMIISRNPHNFLDITQQQILKTALLQFVQNAHSHAYILYRQKKGQV